jgi:hypothetical protein
MEDKVAYLQRLFGLQVDADTSLDTGSLDASGTNVSLEANELSKADTPSKEPADAQGSKLGGREEASDQTESVLAGL